MKNNIYELNLTAAVALSEAARSAGVNTNEITDEEITLDNGYYEVRFTSDWLQYDCYVDAATGEVPGITTMPLPGRRRSFLCEDEGIKPRRLLLRASP